jgi:hypothetical protein
VRVATSGTRERLTMAQAALVRDKVLSLPPGTTVVTGGCVGVDALIATVAYRAGRYHVLTVLPADHSRVDPNWKDHCHEHIQMEHGTTYRQRDAMVVLHGDNLLAFPLYPEDDPRSKRSGTWMTVRLAKRAAKPVEAFVLSEVRD